jgi:uncharacterized membrane protein YphA (DoxX/SURF4 family)
LLTRLYPAFPGGLSGVALLLFRVVLSATLLLEARSSLSAGWDASAAGLAGVTALASGVLLLLGLLTPIAGFIGGIGCAFLAFSGAAAAPAIVDSRQAAVFAITLLAGLVALGPGAFSIDARLFGRREIIIPPPVHPSQR